MKKEGKPSPLQSHDAEIKQLNRDIIGVALTGVTSFQALGTEMWMAINPYK